MGMKWFQFTHGIFKSKVDSLYFGQMLPDEEKKRRAIIPPSEVIQVYVKPTSENVKTPASDKSEKPEPAPEPIAQTDSSNSNFYSLTSSEVFQYILYAWLKDRPEFKSIHTKRNIGDPGVKDLVMDNIKDHNCRFMIVRTESSIIDDLFYRALRNQHIREYLNATGSGNNPEQEASSWHVGAERIIDWRDVKDSENVNDLLSKFKTYVSNGYVVVMKNLQSLYGGLYDLFNQKYTLPQTDKEKAAEDSKRCFLYLNRHILDL